MRAAERRSRIYARQHKYDGSKSGQRVPFKACLGRLVVTRKQGAPPAGFLGAAQGRNTSATGKRQPGTTGSASNVSWMAKVCISLRPRWIITVWRRGSTT